MGITLLFTYVKTMLQPFTSLMNHAEEDMVVGQFHGGQDRNRGVMTEEVDENRWES